MTNYYWNHWGLLTMSNHLIVFDLDDTLISTDDELMIDPELLKHVKEYNPIIILTARNADAQTAMVTQNMLTRHGIRQYFDHIIYCSRVPKGLCLKTFLDNATSHYQNRDIVFFDDLEENLQSVRSIFPNAITYQV